MVGESKSPFLREDAFASPRKTYATPRDPPLIRFCPPCRDYAKTFPRLARPGAAVPDANSVADRPAARFARASQEKPGHAASVRG